MLQSFSEVEIEFFVVVGGILATIFFFLASILLIGWVSGFGKKSEASFNAGIVSLMFGIISLVIVFMMWMFYPTYFSTTVRTLFSFGGG